MMSNFFNFYSHPYNSNIAKGIYILDQYVRQDICDGYIVSEPDYISTLISYIRLFLRSNQLVKNMYTFQSLDSKTLAKSSEQIFGCDALILIRAGNRAKICMFEAKFPRLKSNGSWDSYQKSSNKSHFHDQLTRQHEWSSSATIWELFINDYIPGYSLKGFDKYGSTCIWHQDAYKYSKDDIDNKPPFYIRENRQSDLWDNDHLQECIKNLPDNSLNLEDILNSVLLGK
ncbi:hypothetical protein [Dendronalium sp. ChiSLP03b]|uniref:hypothetical protein n=1 Tax=Dendronalium sp. ChiSLP03b TaxID=3075381 RepID=UPI002AD4A5E2|nr:hypothetical protein [Dendronalium sp. ChiSLP03b]MDZ8205833.1 hypothetical protein [Dendronalium sp. ChiSLP03b]